MSINVFFYFLEVCDESWKILKRDIEVVTHAHVDRIPKLDSAVDTPGSSQIQFEGPESEQF